MARPRARARSIPASTNVKLVNLPPRSNEDAIFMVNKPYRSLVGALLFVSMTCRPDISTVVQQLSQNLIAPHRLHWTTALGMVVYLLGTATHGLHYKSKTPLRAYSDASRVTDAGYKSTFGYVIISMILAAVIWGCKSQRAVSLSSCEAELYAVSVAAQMVLWARMFLNDIGITLARSHNGGRTIKAITDQAQNSRMKHVAIRKAFVDAVEEKKVELKWVPTDENPADFFTKLLAKEKFQKFKRMHHGRATGVRIHDFIPCGRE